MLMRKFCVFLFAISTFGISSVYAKMADDIVIVDVKKIEEEAAVVKYIKTKIDKKQQKLQDEVEKERNIAQKKIADLQKIGNSISKDAFEKKQKNLEKELAATEQKLQNKARDFQNLQLEIVTKVDDKIREITAQIAKKEGYSVVISSASLLYASDSINITDDVLKALNREMSTIEVSGL